MINRIRTKFVTSWECGRDYQNRIKTAIILYPHTIYHTAWLPISFHVFTNSVKDLVWCVIIFSRSTWVKSRFCSWSGIGGSGKAWLPMPWGRRNRACRCLDSWDVSTTLCLTRPLAHWPFSPQVRQKIFDMFIKPFQVCLPLCIIFLFICRDQGDLCAPFLGWENHLHAELLPAAPGWS